MSTGDKKPVARRRRRLYQAGPEQPVTSQLGPEDSAASQPPETTPPATPEVPEAPVVPEAPAAPAVPAVPAVQEDSAGLSQVRAERLAKAEQIVQNHMKWAMGLGLIPIPLIDVVTLVGSQATMLTELGANYDIPLAEIRQKSLLTAAVSGFVTQSLAARSICYLLWWVPVLGIILGPLTFSGLAGACTYAVGHVFIRHFENGGTLADFRPEEAQEHFDEQLEQGKGEAKRIRA